tara:strand:+ start:10305 stop:11309 length:1005 start_codon:yes stop_codon:yes gene_type:complete
MNKLNFNYTYTFFLPKKHHDKFKCFLTEETLHSSLFTANQDELVASFKKNNSQIKILFYYLDSFNNNEILIRKLKKLSFFTDIVILMDDYSSKNIKNLIPIGIHSILEFPFYKSELNLIIENSSQESKKNKTLKHLLHVCDDINDFIYYKTIELNPTSYKDSTAIQYDFFEKNVDKLPFSNLNKNYFSPFHQQEGSSSILIVEDNVELNSKMTQWFQQQNYTVQMALSYQEAIQALQTDVPEFMFIDIALDGYSGEDLIQYVTDFYPTVIPIVITAFNDNELMLKCMNTGAYDFITKPFNPNDILNKFRYYKNKKTIKNFSLNKIKKIALSLNH